MGAIIFNRGYNVMNVCTLFFYYKSVEVYIHMVHFCYGPRSRSSHLHPILKRS